MRLGLQIGKWTLAAFLSFCFLYPIFIFIIHLATPKASEIMAGLDSYQPTKVYDRKGNELYNFAKRKMVLTWDQLKNTEFPHILIQSEDKRFLEHDGVDYRSMARALVGIFSPFHTGGGSTLTQQLVKNRYTGYASRNFFGRIAEKVEEIVIAAKIENHYSKEDILTAYLNEFDFIYNSIGVAAASKTYYNKNYRELSPVEACGILAMLRNPTTINPVLGKTARKEWKERTQLLYELAYQSLPKRLPTPHLNRYKPPANDQIILKIQNDFKKGWKYFDLSKSTGLEIYTTLDPTVQRITSNISRSHFMGLPPKVMGGAVVIDIYNGDILGYFGGVKRDYDWVSTVKRPIGSTIKPILYAFALDKNLITPCTRFYDRPVTVPTDLFKGSNDWKPKNARGFTKKTYPYHQALYLSLNNAFADLINRDTGLELIKDIFGKSKQDYFARNAHPKHYLGAFEISLLDLASLYMMFSPAEKGYFQSPRFYKSLKSNFHGDVPSPEDLFSTKSIKSSRVINDTRDALCHPNGIVGKTGTHNNNSDALYVGMQKGYLVLVRVGSVSGKVSVGTGASVARPLAWRILKALPSRASNQNCTKKRNLCKN